MRFERMLDQDQEPTREDMLRAVGENAGLWQDLLEYLETHYDHVSDLDFGGKKYGWAMRYRKSGKTLVTLFPEKGAFTALVVLGRKEVEKAQALLDDLSPDVRALLENTQQLHDGRWLWIRPGCQADIESIKALLSTKRKPRPKNP
ncbi:MAG: DUF3788 domain-containing protein [Theionarchaea archaeon]|nr:DUF3788 domain-containing protein [Theionarchaea archaeon]MBU7038867.1 DUF3788 domain-containing protein [Theionarchaea archaeon]